MTQRSLANGIPAALASLLVAATGCHDATAPRSQPPEVSVAGGDQQFGLTGGMLAQPIVVDFKTPRGDPLPGVPVHLSVASGGGMLSDSVLLTDPDGLVSFSWRLGPTEGVQQAQVRADGIDLTITATAVSPVIPGLDLTSGLSQTCRRVASGFECWGLNLLDLYTGVPDYTPTSPPGGFTFTQLNSGNGIACGLIADGSAYCWGNGLLGNGSTDAASPVAVTTTERFATLSTGGNGLTSAHNGLTCGVTLGGTTMCWGQNSGGGVGNGSYGNELPFPTVTLTPKQLLLVRVGGSSACGLDGDGLAWCWGSNGSGQLGNGRSGRTELSAVPDTVAGGLRFRSLDLGYATACGLTVDDRVYCWGEGANGERGDGSTQYIVTTPTPVAGDVRWQRISLGSAHACGISTTGEAFCWGKNYHGQLGDGNRGVITRQLTPTPVATGDRFLDLAAGAAHTCGRTTTGSTLCWGWNQKGQLGRRTAESPDPVLVVGGHSWQAVSAGPSHVCGVDTGGDVWCWGDNLSGQVGGAPEPPGTSPEWSVPSPRRVSGLSGFGSIAAGLHSTCGATAGGQAWCWGDNTYGQLGDGTSTSTSTPVAVLGGHQFTSVTVAWTFGCAIDVAESAWCWGTGTLGDGGPNLSPTPVAVAGGHRFRTIGTDAATCGLGTDSTAWCWGWNRQGEFGDSATADQIVSTPIRGFPNLAVSGVAGGGGCVVAIDGTVWCAGRNDLGQLGDGTYISRPTPAPISSGYAFQQVARGGIHLCGLTTSGEAWCWGDANNTPQPVTGGHSFTALTAGIGYTCGLTPAAELYCWGSNIFGQLGIGYAEDVPLPIPVP